MTITKHAKERMSERFGIRSDSEITKLKRKFERDFIRCKIAPDKKIIKTIIWKEAYLKGVFECNTLITVIHEGWTALHFIKKSNPALKRRYRNRRGNHEKTICR